MPENKRIVPALVALGALARLIPHPWNFTPMMAIGLYAGARSPKLRTGIFITLLALLLSDAMMGFYGGMWYVYAASLVPVLLGRLAGKWGGSAPIVAGAMVSSLSFFLITNFMFWATGHLYPRDAAGLGACFVAAIPFFRNQLAGDAFYCAALFGSHALVSRLAQPQLRTA